MQEKFPDIKLTHMEQTPSPVDSNLNSPDYYQQTVSVTKITLDAYNRVVSALNSAPLLRALGAHGAYFLSQKII